jgi:hypothetical protein
LPCFVALGRREAHATWRRHGGCEGVELSLSALWERAEETGGGGCKEFRVRAIKTCGKFETDKLYFVSVVLEEETEENTIAHREPKLRSVFAYELYD